MFFSNLEIDRMVQGVVRQHPPIRLAPHSCHLFASNSKLFSPTHSGCCQDQKTRSKLQESKYEVQSFLMLNYLQFTSIRQFFSEMQYIAAKLLHIRRSQKSKIFIWGWEFICWIIWCLIFRTTSTQSTTVRLPKCYNVRGKEAKI